MGLWLFKTQTVTKKWWDLLSVLPRFGRGDKAHLTCLKTAIHTEKETIFCCIYSIQPIFFSFPLPYFPVPIMFIRLYDKGEKYGRTHIRWLSWAALAGRCCGVRRRGEREVIWNKQTKKTQKANPCNIRKRDCLNILYVPPFFWDWHWWELYIEVCVGFSLKYVQSFMTNHSILRSSKYRM